MQEPKHALVMVVKFADMGFELGEQMQIAFDVYADICARRSVVSGRSKKEQRRERRECMKRAYSLAGLPTFLIGMWLASVIGGWAIKRALDRLFAEEWPEN